MYNVNDILAALEAGTSETDIADAFAAALNSARKEYAAKAAEREKASREAHLNELAQEILDAMNAYIEYADPEVAKWVREENDEFGDVSEIRKLLDATIKIAQTALKFMDNSAENAQPASLSIKTAPTSGKDSDAAIKAFLSGFGLL